MAISARRRSCTLVITHQCNLNCAYCYEKYKDGRSMDEATAKKIIQDEFAHTRDSSEYDEIEVDFFGGEPFCRFELMKSIMEWCWSRKWDVPYIFSATTNGTLLSADIKRWLRENKDRFKVILSCDGLANSHNLNRNGSAGVIDFDFFKEVYPDQFLKMTVSPATVNEFSRDVTDLLERGFLVAPGWAYGMNWHWLEILEYRKQLLTLAEYFLAHPDKPLIPIFEKDLRVIFNREPIARTCGCGLQMSTYDVDGNAYPCQLFLPIVTGRQYGGSIPHDGALNDTRCDGCCIERVCKTCYGFNVIDNGQPTKRSMVYCYMSQAEIIACAWYLYKKAESTIRRGEKLDVVLGLNVKAALKILDAKMGLDKSRKYKGVEL